MTVSLVARHQLPHIGRRRVVERAQLLQLTDADREHVDEDRFIDLAQHFGLDAIRVEDRSGVWLPATDTRRERKICAIGVRVTQRLRPLVK